jgi:fructoselysine-6-P-deglycase FrlB-like protein
MQVAKYVLDGLVAMPIDTMTSYELVWRAPALLDAHALAFFASYSGETEDTLAALRFAKERGAATVAIVGRRESTMAREADVVIPYSSGAIFEVPIAALIHVACGLAEGTPSASAAQRLRDGLSQLPDVLRHVMQREEGLAEERARDLLRTQHLYVLGAGPLGPLAYKLAMSVVMENVRIGATYSDAVEWRHGPVEALERMRADVLVLLGTDASRGVTERTVEFCRAQGCHVTIYDASEYGDVHPLLTPLVMNSQTQWLVVYWAILRGITDLDERVFMGHNVLAAGGAQWP